MATRADAAPTSSGEAVKKLKVLVPVDESDGSLYALRWALDNLFPVVVGEQDSSCMLTLLNVQPIFQPFLYPAGPVVYATSSVMESVKKAQQDNSAAILSRAMQICKEKKMKAETLILEGDPKEKICAAAEQLHADVVVVGSRGLGTVKRALLGSVSSYCAHHVHCPVLIVKPPPKTAHE